MLRLVVFTLFFAVTHGYPSEPSPTGGAPTGGPTQTTTTEFYPLIPPWMFEDEDTQVDLIERIKVLKKGAVVFEHTIQGLAAKVANQIIILDYLEAGPDGVLPEIPKKVKHLVSKKMEKLEKSFQEGVKHIHELKHYILKALGRIRALELKGEPEPTGTPEESLVDRVRELEKKAKEGKQKMVEVRQAVFAASYQIKRLEKHRKMPGVLFARMKLLEKEMKEGENLMERLSHTLGKVLKRVEALENGEPSPAENKIEPGKVAEEIAFLEEEARQDKVLLTGLKEQLKTVFARISTIRSMEESEM